MYLIVGYDEDGTRHTWNYCETMEEAKEKILDVIPLHAQMVEQYKDAIQRIGDIADIDKRKLELSYWKAQGFLIERFEIKEESDVVG